MEEHEVAQPPERPQAVPRRPPCGELGATGHAGDLCPRLILGGACHVHPGVDGPSKHRLHLGGPLPGHAEPTGVIAILQDCPSMHRDATSAKAFWEGPEGGPFSVSAATAGRTPTQEGAPLIVRRAYKGTLWAPQTCTGTFLNIRDRVRPDGRAHADLNCRR